MDEQWRDIPGFSRYQVSNYGRIRNHRGEIRRRSVNVRTGYVHCAMYDDNDERRTLLVHGIVARAFIGPRPAPGYEIHHIDNNPLNNHYRNLQWVTRQFNIQESFRNPLRTRIPRHMPRYSQSVRDQIRELYSQGCSIRQISRDLGITTTTVSRIAQNKKCRTRRKS